MHELVQAAVRASLVVLDLATSDEVDVRHGLLVLPAVASLTLVMFFWL